LQGKRSVCRKSISAAVSAVSADGCDKATMLCAHALWMAHTTMLALHRWLSILSASENPRD